MEPSAITEVGLALTVQLAALPGPALTTNVTERVYVPEQPLFPEALMLTPLDVPTGVVADVVTVARGAEHGSAKRQCDRCAHYAACWLRRQSEEKEADRGVLRLVEGHRATAQTENRGLFKVGWIFTFAAAAYDLVRMRKLIPIPPAA